MGYRATCKVTQVRSLSTILCTKMRFHQLSQTERLNSDWNRTRGDLKMVFGWAAVHRAIGFRLSQAVGVSGLLASAIKCDSVLATKLPA